MPIIMSVWINILHVRTLFVFSSPTVATFSAFCFSVYRLFTDFALWSTQRNFNSLLSILHYYVSLFFMSVFHFFLPTYLSTYLSTYPRINKLPTHLLTHLHIHRPTLPCPSLAGCTGCTGRKGEKDLIHAMQCKRQNMTKFKFCSAYFFRHFCFFSFFLLYFVYGES